MNRVVVCGIEGRATQVDMAEGLPKNFSLLMALSSLSASSQSDSREKMMCEVCVDSHSAF